MKMHLSIMIIGNFFQMRIMIIGRRGVVVWWTKSTVRIQKALGLQYGGSHSPGEAFLCRVCGKNFAVVLDYGKG